MFPHLSSAKPGFLFTCNLHKNGCILQYFRMKIDRSLLAIVKQIISPQATLIHKMFQMGTITYSFPLISHSSTHHHFSSPWLNHKNWLLPGAGLVLVPVSLWTSQETVRTSLLPPAQPSPAQPRVAPVTWRQVLDKHIVLHSPLAQALRGFHPKFVFNIFVVHSFGNMPNLDYWCAGCRDQN